MVRKPSVSEKDVTARIIINELHNETPNDLHTSVTILSLVPSWIQWDAHVPWMEEMCLHEFSVTSFLDNESGHLRRLK